MNSITFSTLHLDNLKTNKNFLNLEITSTWPTRICCSSTIFNMRYATPAQPKIGTDKILQLYTHSLRKWFQRFTPRNLKSFLRYHCTLHLHNLTFTILEKLDFRILQLHNLKSLSTICLYNALAQPDFYYICTTWVQGSTLV